MRQGLTLGVSFVAAQSLTFAVSDAGAVPVTRNADSYYDYAAESVDPGTCSAHDDDFSGCVGGIGCAWTPGSGSSGTCDSCSTRAFQSTCVNANTGCTWESGPPPLIGHCVNREVAAMDANCAGTPPTCYSNVVADLESDLLGNVTPFTANEVDSAHATYFRGDSVAFGNLAFFNNGTGSKVADGLLLLFVPGCNNHPRDYTHFLLRAAKYGYHVISVPYWDVCGTTWEGDTRASGENECQQDASNPDFPGLPFMAPWDFASPYNTTMVRFSPSGSDDATLGGVPSVDQCLTRLARYKWEDSVSQDLSYLVGYHFAPPDDSAGGARDNIQHRVLKWLQFLDTNYPTQNWHQFFGNGQVLWYKTTVAGHSQGSASVPYAMQSAFPFRGIMLSGPEAGVGTVASGNIEVPTYVDEAAPSGLIMYDFYGALDDGGPRFIVDTAAMQLPAGSASGTGMCQDSTTGYVEFDVSSPCVAPSLSLLQTAQGHRLVALSGGHNSVRGELGDVRPFVYQAAWDYMLTGKSGPGGLCPEFLSNANDWCTTGTTCSAFGVCTSN